PTYTTCGYFGVSFRKFILASMTATVFWTSGLFAVSMKVGDVLMEYFGEWRWAGIVVMIIALAVAGRFASRLWKDAHQE
ncbi:MAG TPA: hypothetical protein VFW75_05635, partial [Acetobacteraceae bacterium]|nr:hypothetical protein [Acetobacteraceae bacterium]